MNFLHIGEGIQSLLAEFFRSGLIMGMDHIQINIFPKTVFNVMLDGLLIIFFA